MLIRLVAVAAQPGGALQRLWRRPHPIRFRSKQESAPGIWFREKSPGGIKRETHARVSDGGSSGIAGPESWCAKTGLYHGPGLRVTAIHLMAFGVEL